MNLILRRILARTAAAASGGYGIRPWLHRMRGVGLGQRVWLSQGVYLVLAQHLRGNEAFTCGIVRAEDLRGIVSPLLRDWMSERFNLIQAVPTDAAVWNETAALAWKLDRQPGSRRPPLCFP